MYFPTPELVGRARELSSLRETWAGGSVRPCRAIALVGGAGTGKTRLALELADEVDRSGGRILAVRPDWIECEAAATVAATIREQGPTLVLVDDLSWLDSRCRAWLSTLARELAGLEAEAMVVAAYTPIRQADIESLLAPLAPSFIELGPLDDHDATRLARLFAGASAGETRIAEMSMISGGNPGLLSLLAFVSVPGTPLPRTWEEAAEQLLARLEPAVRRLVEALAILRFPLPPEAVLKGFDLEPVALPAFLQDQPQGIALAPSYLAGLLASKLPASLRIDLHRRAGALFEPRSPLAAVMHYERSADPAALRRALLSAARTAEDLNAIEEARIHLERALEADSAGPPAPEIWLGLGHCELTSGRYAQGVEILAPRQASLRGSERAAACRLLAQCLERLGDFGLASAYCNEGLVALGHDDDAARASLVAELATIALRQGRYDEARSLATEAIALAPEAPSVDRDLAHSILGICHYREGRFAAALTEHRIALEGREARKDLPGIANALNNLANAHYEVGDWGPALECYERGLAITRAARDDATSSAILNNLASLYLVLGQLDRAEDACQQALAEKIRAGESAGQAIAQATLAAILARKGDTRQALATIEDAIARVERLGANEILADVYGNWGEILTQAGRAAQAWSAFYRALAVAGSAAGAKVRAWRGLARLLVAQGRPEEAVPLARRAVDVARKIGRPLEVGRSLQVLAVAEGPSVSPATDESEALLASLGVDGR